jgi:flagellar biosynthesis/type III secretory pathway M-ring protein FliF/YscJ
MSWLLDKIQALPWWLWLVPLVFAALWLGVRWFKRRFSPPADTNLRTPLSKEEAEEQRDKLDDKAKEEKAKSKEFFNEEEERIRDKFGFD